MQHYSTPTVVYKKRRKTPSTSTAHPFIIINGHPYRILSGNARDLIIGTEGFRKGEWLMTTISLPCYPSFSAVIEITSAELEGHCCCRIKSANKDGTRKLVQYFT